MIIDKPTERSITEILNWIKDDDVGIPDFQRGFVWGTKEIEDFLESILRGYYIGAFLLWSPKDPTELSPNRIKGVPSTKKFNPTYLILDGQQRISSLYYAIKSPNLKLWGKREPYRFFIDLDKILNIDDLDDAKFVVSYTYKETEQLNLFDETEQFKKELFPITSSEIAPLNRWLNKFEKYSEKVLKDTDANKKREKLEEYLSQLSENFSIPVILLPKTLNLNTVAKIFEKLNNTGQKLTTFDLLTARLTKHRINLRTKLWNDAKTTFNKISLFSKEDDEIFPIKILETISLLRGPESTENLNILGLNFKGFAKDWEEACTLMNYTLDKLMNLKDHYGVFSPKWLPYFSMLPVLATLFSIAKSHVSVGRRFEKIRSWYWSSIYFGYYDSPSDFKMISDITSVTEWFVHENQIPKVVENSQNITFKKLESVTPGNAFYKSIMTLIALHGAKDFLSGETLELHNVDDHHIFPKSKANEYEAGEEINSILNRTLIEQNTNRKYIGNDDPNVYLKKIMKDNKLRKDEMQSLLESHLISKKAFDCLWKNDFHGFIEERKTTIIEAYLQKLTFER